mmetsp:Transcript_14410/g.25355  ORF Transcript_14410/g.25355 Transcript_14410/m.25355 type:complete len:438 (+) Transcript_14410:63-1376(+)
MDTSAASSSLARKFDFLHERSQRKPVREAGLDSSNGLSNSTTKSSISNLKEFYLQRLSRNEPSVAARLAAKADGNGGSRIPVRNSRRPSTSQLDGTAGGPKKVEEMEVMCTNCFNLLKASDASSDSHPCALGTCSPATQRPLGNVELLDMKLQSLRAALEARIQDNENKVNVLRHLTQLRYHITTAGKWSRGCAEIGPLSNHTVQQVKQLTATSRVLAPAVYIFSKRVENIILQKERTLQNAASAPSSNSPAGRTPMSAGTDSSYEMKLASSSNRGGDASVVAEMDSDCGTQYAETAVTQDGPSTDVGNVQDANEYLSLRNEDEQRRWFYSQCLAAKLACSDQNKARKILISDLYAKVRSEKVPLERWSQWIKNQLNMDDTSTAPSSGTPTETCRPFTLHNSVGSLASTLDGSKRYQQDLDRTAPVPQVTRFSPPVR